MYDLNPELIGLDPQKAGIIAGGLNKYLANLNVLYVKLHNLHWNVVGIGFFDLHEKTEEMYEFVAAELDRIAERILMLGYKPLASMHDYLRVASIKEIPSQSLNATTVSTIIIDDFVTVLNEIRELAEIVKETNDEYTIALLGEAMGFFEKNIWMLTAYITRSTNK